MSAETFETFVDRVVGVMDPHASGANRTLQEKMRIVLRRLHETIREIGLTEEELGVAADFLTSVGKTEEVVVLTHLLGIDMHVKDLVHGGFARETIDNVEGPLFKPHAPWLDNPGKLREDSDLGEPLVMSGQVLDVGTRRPIVGAIIDIWHSDAGGAYSQDDPKLPEWKFRGRMRTDHQGHYTIETIIPGGYEQGLAKDSPCGHMLTLLGRHRMRPGHIHFRVSAPGFHPLITLTYFPGDPYLETDSVFSVRPQLLLDLERHTGQATRTHFDFVLRRRAQPDEPVQSESNLDRG